MQKGREGALCVILPLQNTKGHMHTIRTIDIGLHKERVVYAYSTCTVLLCSTVQVPVIVLYLREHVFTNEQAGHQPTFQRILIIITMQCNHVRYSTAVTAAVNSTTTTIIHAVILAAVRQSTVPQ